MPKRNVRDSPFAVSPLYEIKRRRKDAPRAVRALLQHTTMQDLMKKCGTKQDAAQFAVDLGLVSPVTCRCGSEMKLKSAAAQKFSVQGVMWKSSRCKDKTGFFASSARVVRALGPKELILLLYLWAQGTDYEQISHEVGVSYRHVCDLGTQLRECLWDYLQNYCDTRQLGGVDVVCEIDETEYGRKMKN